jgi:hypothetical protein
MKEFLLSDTGLIIGVMLLVLGASDIISAFIISKKLEQFPISAESWNRMLTLLMPIACFLVLFGLYVIALHL